ncbi:MAG: hypothetical protein HPY61_00925 [Methanotrichaceae archaeon]|nr:hypothetical protein [Methanotrichaceae archaeon]
MPDPFNDAIASWANFYMLAGSVAATLVGLIFVSVSLHIDFLAKAKRDSELHTTARHTFGNFLIILSFAFIFMVPSDSTMGLGIPLLILGLLMLLRTGQLWLKFAKRRAEEQAFTSNQMLWELLIPNTVCYLVVVYLAVQIIEGITSNLDWMVMVIIWLIISATKNAWDLMLQVAEMKNAKQ